MFMPTVWHTIPTLETLQDKWETFAAMQKFHKLKWSIEKGLAKLNKDYQFLDQNNVVFISLALDPNFKLEYAKESWDSKYFGEGMAALEQVFDIYAAGVASKTPQSANDAVLDSGKYT
ncbi:hypothetical protein PAXRUDRAFT_17096 [Paxillus rubicundulus Ve08.2h10]|uniref:hAT-like transposase RNase-H fold domain-containing protein n=1 Tax=Paxillus rubicundulus Ve08.2h10 TaxID=930991 RepID=A0A0D0DIV9_9AGAM|nr:hypothetical protein PAXRUDRAFT_17096 [Paxillus rubicundulus Ve08.2h10]